MLTYLSVFLLCFLVADALILAYVVLTTQPVVGDVIDIESEYADMNYEWEQEMGIDPTNEDE